MIEKHYINEKEVWIKIDPHPVERKNPHIIPTEYFIATYYNNEPGGNSNDGEKVKVNGETKLFESPVAALSYARKFLEKRSTEQTEEQRTQQTQQEQKETD